MKRHSIALVLALFALSLGTGVCAQEVIAPEGGGTAGAAAAAEGRPINAFTAGKIIGSDVINSRGQTLGKIGNLVIDIDTGRVLYALLEPGEAAGGDRFYPVPWESLSALPLEGIFFLNQSKEQMASAPVFDKRNLRNLTDARWGEDIFNHYGIPGYANRGTLGFSYGYYGYQGYPTPPAARQDPYQKFFDPNAIRTVSGEVMKIDHVPVPGFGMEMRITVFVGPREILPVYLGPTYYVESPGPTKYFRRGDKVTVTGSQVTVRGELFVLATSVKLGSEILQLRDKEGNPEWVGWRRALE